ncbi:MAG: polyprenyl synthetase [Bacteroidetes bacterium GWA2_31_9]|nr:MAG: polyprenyl synthetase [Bacteroidetes bacterium GWA2_31_9]
MISLENIQHPISQEMEKFEPFFRDIAKSKVPLLDTITNYIYRRKGKQMRPMLVFLSAKLNGEINNSSFIAASLIELLHTATLIHDDVVDESNMRRGFFSVNALWKNKIAVLVGDYFLSKGLLLAIDNDHFKLLKIVSEAVREMSEGELLQIEKARKLDINEDIYYEIIRKKTATLIAACSACGASSANADDSVVLQMKQFGEYLGMAFQIKDDILDYQSTGFTGKPSGNDLKEKKMTLPLIYALNNSSFSEKRHIMSIIKNHHKNAKKLNEVIKYVVDKGGIAYSEQKMEEYKQKSLEILYKYPESEVKNSLVDFVEFTINRKK